MNQSPNKTNLLGKFIIIQNNQEELDKLKKQNREIVSRIRALAQKIPQLIRELELK